MIKPIREGSELIAEIASSDPAPGSICLWWLGQSGFLVKSRAGLLAIDLYLSDHLTRKYAGTDRPHVRMMAPVCGANDLLGVDLVLASHKHSDHLDPGTLPELLACSPSTQLVLPEALLEYAEGLGLPTGQLIGMDAGQTIERAGFRVRAIPAAHEDIQRDGRGKHLYLGFVVETEGRRLYHSGDSLAFEGLLEWLGPEQFDVILLPINGRDPSRGVPGNMTAAEAIDLATRVRPRYVVPHHYDMFTFNTVPVGRFEAEALRLPPGIEARVLRCGERWEIGP